ncbi:MAG: leucine-rich repeat domain-containing protein [Verrucomicrobia bacterium]|nr:leucine-rich repeat domain-containing protein [Verrucomicrobiota bacterium]
MCNQITQTNQLPVDTIQSIVFFATESANHEDLHTLCASRTVNHGWKIAVDSGYFEMFWRIATSENSLFRTCIPLMNPSEIEKLTTATFIKGFYPSYNKIPDDEVPRLYWKLTCQDPTDRKDWEMRSAIQHTCNSFEKQTKSIQDNPSCQKVLGSPVLLKFACLSTELQNPRLGILPSEHSCDIALETVWRKFIQHRKDGLKDIVKAVDIRAWVANPDNAQMIGMFRSLSPAFVPLTQLPPELCKFTGLQYLDISHNKLTFLPESIGNLTSLTSFFANDNQLLSLPDSFGNLVNLDNVHLSNNQLLTIPRSLGNITDQNCLFWMDDNPCLFNLNSKLCLEEKLTQREWLYFSASHKKIHLSETIRSFTACISHQCISPLAALCKSILLQEDQPFEAEQPLLAELFSQLPQEMQNQIKANLGPGFQDPPCKNQVQLANAIISTLQSQFENLSDGQRKLVYYLVWDMAGQPPTSNKNWGECEGSKNVMLLIDAFAVAKAIWKYEALTEDQKKLVHFHNWNLAETPQEKTGERSIY